MRAELAALLASAYLVAVFVWHRVRLRARVRSGPALEWLRRFDYRAVWEELSEAPAGPGAPAPCAEALTAPRFYAVSPWELPEPPAHRELRDALARGERPRLEPGGDPQREALLCHFAVRRILGGDLAGARALALPLERGRRERLLATVELADAERALQLRDEASARQSAARAWRHLQRAGARSAGLDYLDAHLRLCWFTDGWNLELSVARAAFALRRSLRRHPGTAALCFALAHAQALLGRHEESLDELGRALYFSRGDRFYAQAIEASSCVAQLRPALLAHCRATEGREGPALAGTPAHVSLPPAQRGG